MKYLLPTAVICALSMACVAPTNDLETSVDEFGVGARVLDGSPEALGMLAFLNHADTTFDLLDHDVGLDRRAAESIIAHRNGPDGVLGYLHDDLFDTIEEVDDRYYVGETALRRIEMWAIEHDWVALQDTDILGSWDGVEFTVAEAESTLELANTSGHDYLDDDLALDVRAVNSIFAARPIDTVQELSGLYYVGKTALTALKEASTGTPDCTIAGWDTQYIYDAGDEAWRTQLPIEYVEIVDEVLDSETWCGEASGRPWFVKASIDRFNCDDRGYTIELGQYMIGAPEVSWYIEFEVTQDFEWDHSTCEV